MTKRERVIQALNHKEPDRVPIDLGGSDSSGISGVVYNKLKSHFGIQTGSTKIFCTYQQIALVEKEISEAINSDIQSVMIQAKNWKPWTLSDGTPCEIPETWNPIKEKDGSEIIQNDRGEITAIKPETGEFFEPIYTPLKDCDEINCLNEYEDDFRNFDIPSHSDMSFEEMGRIAKNLRETSDFFLTAGNFAAHIFAAGQSLRGWETFLLDLLERPAFAEALMDKLVQVYIERFDEFWKHLGPYVDAVIFSDDLGMQENLFISPDLYRKIIKPYHKKLFSYVKEKSDAYIFLHSCGSVYKLIPDFIEVGVDILNPVQVSAANMDSKNLKKEFGDSIVFWGGGIDTQKILPTGTKEEVRDEVKKRIDDFAPGGGFVFNTVHNILPNVPLENVLTMYETVWEYGKY